MKKITTIALLLSTVIAVPAFAQNTQALNAGDSTQWVDGSDGTVSRAQVRADLVKAERAGVVAAGDDHTQYPARYQALAAQGTTPKTRAEVRAELVAAEQAGAMPVSSYATTYPEQVQTAIHGDNLPKTRAEVRAELAQAVQTGYAPQSANRRDTAFVYGTVVRAQHASHSVSSIPVENDTAD